MAENKKENLQVENLRFYEMMRSVPQEALKQIKGGRLSGMSDINPLFRIKVMTKAFGPCGIGWKYEITKQWHETFAYDAIEYEIVNGVSTPKKVQRTEIKAFCNINLYIKVSGEWSEPIPGLGGSTVMTYEKSGYYVSDEADKMALTDAMGVAMKALGVAADVYWEGGRFETKYDTPQQDNGQPNTLPTQANPQVQPIQASKEDKKLALTEIYLATTIDQLKAIYGKFPQLQKEADFTGALTARKDQIMNNGKS